MDRPTFPPKANKKYWKEWEALDPGADVEIFRHLARTVEQEPYGTAAKNFYDMACYIVRDIQPGPERSVALRKLLESKECIIRALISPGG